MLSDGIAKAPLLPSWLVAAIGRVTVDAGCVGAERSDEVANDNSPIVSTKAAIDQLTVVRFKPQWPFWREHAARVRNKTEIRVSRDNKSDF